MSMEDNYHQHHQCTTVQEAERHIDHNQEITTIIRQIIKETTIRITNITVETQVITETISKEAEQTVTTETIVTIDITIVDETQDTQTVVNQDTNHHITKIIIVIKIIIIITDKHSTADSNRTDRYRQRSNSNNRHYSNNNNRTDRRKSSHREQNNRHQSKDGRTDGNRYNNNHNKGRINNRETDRPNEDPPGIDEYEYTSESSNEDQEILDKFYNANEDTCNTIVNALESNPTWILPMYQCNKFEQNFTKQKPILEIDFLLDSGATLNLLNEDTWNEIKYNNPEIHLEHLTQNELEKTVTIILDYRQVYATTKFDVGKTKVKLNLPIKKDAIFKKQRICKVPIHLRERIQKLLDELKKYDIIAQVNKEQLSTGNTFTNPVIILLRNNKI